MIKLEKAFNTRDLGGFIITDKLVKSNMLVRSDNTAFLSDMDIRYLWDYGVRTIIDIRSWKEREEEEDVMSTLKEFNYYFIPFDCSDFAYNLSRNPFKLDLSLSEGYKLLLGEKETINRIITLIEGALHNGGVLFHCSGGKDRTGLISMLILTILGIGKEDVLEDYHLTYENLLKSAKIRKWVERFGEEYIYCSPNLMSETIDYLIKKYGSVENYLYNCGISDLSIQSLKNQLLVEV